MKKIGLVPKDSKKPLHSAAKSSQSQTKNTHQANQNGENQLQFAAESGHLDICKSPGQTEELVIDVINDQENGNAVKSGHLDIISNPPKPKKRKVQNEKPSKIIKSNPVSNNEKPIFKCEFCNLVVKNKQNLNRHVKNIHGNNEKNIGCLQCKSKFKTEERLRNHYKLYHLDEKLECSICHAKVIAKFGLNRHMKTQHPK